MAGKHTQGPLRVHVWDKCIFVSSPNNDDVAEFNFRDEHTVSITREEAIANAMLFVGAPDLLEVLKEAYATVSVAQTIAEEAGDHVTAKERGALLAKMNAAIAKAEG